MVGGGEFSVTSFELLSPSIAKETTSLELSRNISPHISFCESRQFEIDFDNVELKSLN